MHYSVDFRQKALLFAETHTLAETAKTFNISVHAISSWRKLLKETGSLAPAVPRVKPRKLDYEKLRKYMDANPDRYLREIAAEFHCAIETIRKGLLRLKITLKKRSNYTKKGTRKNVRSLSKKYQNIPQKI